VSARQRRASTREPDDDGELSRDERTEESPNQPLAGDLVALDGLSEPEAECGGAQLERVSVAQPRSGERFAVECRKRGAEDTCLDAVSAEFKFEVMIPYSGVCETEVRGFGAADGEGEARDGDACANARAREDLELDQAFRQSR